MTDKKDEKKLLDELIKSNNAQRSLSDENIDLKKKNQTLFLTNSVLALSLVVSVILTGMFGYKAFNRNTKYAMVTPDNKIIPFTMYDVPYLTVENRKLFVEKVAISMNSLSFYNRNDILNENYPLFWAPTFKDVISEIENHEIFNKESLERNEISSKASIVEEAALVDDNVTNIPGFPSDVPGEKYEMVISQSVRKKGVHVLNLKYLLTMVLVRDDPNRTSYGYRIAEYKIKPFR